MTNLRAMKCEDVVCLVQDGSGEIEDGTLNSYCGCTFESGVCQRRFRNLSSVHGSKKAIHHFALSGFGCEDFRIALSLVIRDLVQKYAL
jgi:hypothetical protein